MIYLTVGEQHRITVHTDGQYQLHSEHDDVFFCPKSDGLAAGEESWMSVVTGTRIGPMVVDVALLEAMPASVQEGFDMLGEPDLQVGDGVAGPSLVNCRVL
jgi:hypothetical protein